MAANDGSPRIPLPPQAAELKLQMLSSCLPAVGGERADPRTTGTTTAREEAHFTSRNLPEPTGLTNHRCSTNHGINGHGHLAYQRVGESSQAVYEKTGTM